MMAMLMSPAALGLLRALAQRSGVPRDRILLSEWTSVDWQSLTFTGERHQAVLRITGPGSGDIASRIIDGIADADFPLRGHIVADIAAVGAPQVQEDGSMLVNIEALTIAE